MDKFCDRLLEEMEKKDAEVRKRRMEQIKQLECFQCVWSTLRETKLYCPYKGCMKEDR